MVQNAIKVYARLKPERSRRKVTTHEVYHRPKEHVNEDFLVLTAPPKICHEYIDNRPESWNFSFFKIFEETAEQDIIFDEVAKPVIHSVLDGYNGTIFAYGQTGSGKTYTITGEQKNYDLRGILPRTLQYLFDVTKKHPENLYSVEVSYLEIYNENGYDLLNRKQEWTVATKLEDLPRVTIQEDETGTLHLKNLSFWTVSNEKDALDLLFIGDTNRVVSETPMNPVSSRSHCIFTIVVSVKKFGADHYSRAKMHLVDLAGSERVYKCAITGTILTEAKHINLSLHYLEQVIVCLGQQNANHIPYRNSLLTAILRDSLGGNCLTTMLATLSISIKNLEETISTCRFAQRVALVRNDVNLILQKDVHSENTLLKMENERLKQQIESLTKQHVSQSARELSLDEKRSLDNSVERFLESDENFICENDPRKLQYCLESLKRNLKLNKLGNTNETFSSENLGYYKNLVLQRDKEISLLIDMLQKEREKGSKQKLTKDQKKKSEQLKEDNFCKTLTSAIIDVPTLTFQTSSNESEKDVPAFVLKESSARLRNNCRLNQVYEEKTLSFENDTISLTSQDISQLKNLISLYEGHILNQNQLPTVEKYSEKEKELRTPDILPTKNLNFTKQEKMLNPNKNTSESFKESIKIELPKSEYNFSLPKTSENNSNSKLKTQVMSSTTENNKSIFKEEKNRSAKTASVRKSFHPEIVTLNLFEIGRDDLRDDTVSETKNGNSKKHRSKNSSSREKRKLKISSECSLFSEPVDSPSISKEALRISEKYSGRCNKSISPESKLKSVEKSTPESQNVVERGNSLINNNFPIVSSSRINILEQGSGDHEINMSTSKDFTILGNPEMLRKHFGDVTDRSMRSSINLQSSRSMSSVKNEAPQHVSRFPALSRNSICINNDENKLSSNNSSKSNTEFLNSSQRGKNSTADLMYRFQEDLDSTMTLKSFCSPKQGKTSFPISVGNEILTDVEKSANELEKRLLLKKEDNLEEELSRMREYLPSSSRNSFRDQDDVKKKEDLDFEKSLPLTGDPDIDEEIIAFYKAKRAGGTY